MNVPSDVTWGTLTPQQQGVFKLWARIGLKMQWRIKMGSLAWRNFKQFEYDLVAEGRVNKDCLIRLKP